MWAPGYKHLFEIPLFMKKYILSLCTALVMAPLGLFAGVIDTSKNYEMLTTTGLALDNNESMSPDANLFKPQI